MKIKLRNSEIIKINNALKSLQGIPEILDTEAGQKIFYHSYPLKFKYAVSKNKRIFQSIVDDIEAVGKQDTEESRKYTAEIEKIVQPILLGEGGVIVPTPLGAARIKTDEQENFSKEIAALNGKYARLLEDKEKLQLEYKKYLQNEQEIEVYGMSIEWMPASIDQNIFEIIMPLVKETDEEIEKYMMGEDG